MKTTNLLTIATVSMLLVSCVCKSGGSSEEVNFPIAKLLDTPTLTPPPAELNLDPFYEKYMCVNGIHVASSWRVPDSCFYAAYITIKALTEALPQDVRDELIRRGTRIGIMARYEGTTDIPEHRRMVNDTSINWDLRARGLGGSARNPFSTCAEENILAYQIDKYHAEDILIHEFAHTIHGAGISPIYPEFNKELKTSLDNALAAGKWKGVYAAENIQEYFAEGVQDWFNVNAEVNKEFGDGKHNMINTREELKRYDKGLYDILARFLPEVDVQVSRHRYVNEFNWE